MQQPKAIIFTCQSVPTSIDILVVIITTTWSHGFFSFPAQFPILFQISHRCTQKLSNTLWGKFYLVSICFPDIRLREVFHKSQRLLFDSGTFSCNSEKGDWFQKRDWNQNDIIERSLLGSTWIWPKSRFWPVLISICTNTQTFEFPFHFEKAEVTILKFRRDKAIECSVCPTHSSDSALAAEWIAY